MKPPDMQNFMHWVSTGSGGVMYHTLHLGAPPQVRAKLHCSLIAWGHVEYEGASWMREGWSVSPWGHKGFRTKVLGKLLTSFKGKPWVWSSPTNISQQHRGQAFRDTWSILPLAQPLLWFHGCFRNQHTDAPIFWEDFSSLLDLLKPDIYENV